MHIHKVVQQFAQQSVRWLPPQVLARVIEQPLNHLLQAERQRDKFAFLQQHWVHIEISDVPLSLYVCCQQHARRLRVSLQPQTSALRVRADSTAMLQLMLQQVDPDTLFFQRKLLITGDTELGLQLKNLFDTVALAERLPAPLLGWLERTANSPIP